MSIGTIEVGAVVGSSMHTTLGQVLKRTSMRTIVKAMTAQDLAECAQDVTTWQDKGVLADGPLHALAARFVVETGIDEMSSMQQAEAAVLREASLRFIATQTGLRADER